MIARAGLAHCAEMAAIHAACFPRPWSASEIADILSNPAAYAYCARAGEGLMQGFVLAWATAPEAEILTLAVAPEHRRRGLGAQLVAAAQDLARSVEAEAMLLEVAATNHAARALYRRLGYSEVATRRGYYKTATGVEDALVLRRTLI